MRDLSPVIIKRDEMHELRTLIHAPKFDVIVPIHGTFETSLAHVKRVADELDLPSDWLNDGAKGYVTGESEGPILHRSAGIVVRTLAFAHLLALKLMAWRDDVDFTDALRILQALKEQPGTDCSSPEKLSELVEPYFIPSRRMEASYALGELWELNDPAGEDRNSDSSEEPV